MKLFRWLWVVVTLGLLAQAFYVAMFVVPPDQTQGEIQRIFYYHIGSWCGMSGPCPNADTTPWRWWCRWRCGPGSCPTPVGCRRR